MVNRGEVWWVDHPRHGRRPYLVWTRQSAIPVLSRITAVPLTRTIRGAPSELPLDEDDGMPSECVASFDNVATMSKALFTEHICTLNGERLAEACRTMARATGC